MHAAVSEMGAADVVPHEHQVSNTEPCVEAGTCCECSLATHPARHSWAVLQRPLHSNVKADEHLQQSGAGEAAGVGTNVTCFWSEQALP